MVAGKRVSSPTVILGTMKKLHETNSKYICSVWLRFLQKKYIKKYWFNFQSFIEFEIVMQEVENQANAWLSAFSRRYWFSNPNPNVKMYVVNGLIIIIRRAQNFVMFIINLLLDLLGQSNVFGRKIIICSSYLTIFFCKYVLSVSVK